MIFTESHGCQSVDHTMPADSIGHDERASGFAAVGHLLVSEHQQHFASHSSGHHEQVKYISILHEYWRTSDAARKARRGPCEGLASMRQYVRAIAQSHTLRPHQTTSLIQSQMRTLPPAATLVVRVIITRSGCQVALSPQVVQA